MHMEVREQSKIVELWLTKEENNDPVFRESLKPIYQQYKAQKYMVAVFLSGEADLYQQTRDLLGLQPAASGGKGGPGSKAGGVSLQM